MFCECPETRPCLYTPSKCWSAARLDDRAHCRTTHAEESSQPLYLASESGVNLWSWMTDDWNVKGKQRCATPSCSLDLDEHCSAGRLYRCAWRARSRRTYTHATCERRIDAKASSEDAVVDVEVDRCIDENSASNYG